MREVDRHEVTACRWRKGRKIGSVHAVASSRAHDKKESGPMGLTLAVRYQSWLAHGWATRLDWRLIDLVGKQMPILGRPIDCFKAELGA